MIVRLKTQKLVTIRDKGRELTFFVPAGMTGEVCDAAGDGIRVSWSKVYGTVKDIDGGRSRRELNGMEIGLDQVDRVLASDVQYFPEDN